jgi:very-short-patch-repair endonuclease
MHSPIFTLLIVLVVAAAVLGAVAAKLKPRDGLFSKPWPLEAKRELLTERERALYQRLVQTLPNHIVLAQVQLLQVLNFKRGQRTQAIFNRFNQLSLDFLILNPDTSIVAAVELDDSTHAPENRRQADARKDHALKSAGVPLIRWNARSLPDEAAIFAAFPMTASAGRREQTGAV